MLKDARSYNPFTSLRARFLYLMVFLTALTLAAVLFIAQDTIRQESQRAQQLSSQELSNQAQDYLQKLTASAASDYDRSLAHILGEAQNIASMVTSAYAEQAALPGGIAWSVKDHMIQGEQGQFVNRRADPTSVFVPNTRSLGPPEVKDLQLTAYLDWLLSAVVKNNPNVLAAYFGTANEVLRYYPPLDLLRDLPPDFLVTQQPWYMGSLQGGDEKRPYWTPPYVDATGKGIVTTAAVPAYDEAGKLVGVAGIDIALSEMIAGIQKTNFSQHGYSFLIDTTGKAIVLPDQAYRDFLGREPVAGEFGTDLSTSAKVENLLLRMQNGETGLQRIEVEGGELSIAYAPLPSTGWSLANVVDANEVLGAVPRLQTSLSPNLRAFLYERVLPVALAAFLITSLIALLFTDRWFRPLQKLIRAAEKYGKGQWDAEVPSAAQDEVGILTRSFLMMKDNLYLAMRAFEDRITERTRDRDRHAAQVQIVADIAHEITVSRQLEPLLSRIVNLMVDRYNYYFVGVYLFDTRGEYAVLQAAAGEGGPALLEQGRRVRLGSASIIGYVVNSGESRIIQDTSREALYDPHPYLPETRSEIALPLKLGQEVIGILEVHSREVEAFPSYDVTILNMIADQLAVAIDNTRLSKDYQERVQELESLYGRINQQTWKRLIQTREVIGYEYDAAGVKPLHRSDLATMKTAPGEVTSSDISEAGSSPTPALGGKEPYSLPIKVRGEVVAFLDVWPAADSLSSGELRLLTLLNERINQALESARVFEETQNLAFREQTINQFVTNLSNTLDLNVLLQNAVRQLGNMPDVAEISIRLGPGNNHP